MSHFVRWKLMLASTALALLGCGGGGSGDSNPPAPAPSGPDLSVAMRVQRSAALPNQENVVTVTVLNTGSLTASGGVLTVPAITGFAYESASCTPSGDANCPSTTVGQLASGLTLPSMPSASTLTFSLDGVSTGTAGTQLVFLARASASGDIVANNNSAEQVVPINTPAASTLVTSVPPSTYAQGSVELGAFNWINAERTRCGMGMLKQDMRLDEASLDHAIYLSVNTDNGNLSDLTHEQNVMWPGFTGLDGTARARYRGYPGVASDLISVGPAGSVVSGYQLLFGYATYHSLSAQGASKEIGLGQARTALNVENAVLNVGIPIVANTVAEALAAAQLPAGDTVITYPCGGETLLQRSHLARETPSPFPGVNLSTKGPPITIAVRSPQALTITQFSLATQAGLGLSGSLLTSVNRPGLMSADEAAFIPDSVLPPNTTFNVLVRGTNDGQRFEKRFSFATGNTTF